MPAQVNDKVSLHAHQQLGNTGGADPPARKSALVERPCGFQIAAPSRLAPTSRVTVATYRGATTAWLIARVLSSANALPRSEGSVNAAAFSTAAVKVASSYRDKSMLPSGVSVSAMKAAASAARVGSVAGEDELAGLVRVEDGRVEVPRTNGLAVTRIPALAAA